MLLWQCAAEARAGMDSYESTVMDCDIEIYQTVDADADRKPTAMAQDLTGAARTGQDLLYCRCSASPSSLYGGA